MFMSHVLDFFGFMLEFTNPSVVELYILRGVGGCLLRPMREGRIAIPSLALQNVPVVSASAADETTFTKILACGENWYVTLGGWEIRFITRPINEIIMSSIYTAGFSNDKVGSVRVNVEDLFACMVSDDCIRTSCSIIKKPFSLFHSVLCWYRLNTRNIIEDVKHSGVEGP